MAHAISCSTRGEALESVETGWRTFQHSLEELEGCDVIMQNAIFSAYQLQAAATGVEAAVANPGSDGAAMAAATDLQPIAVAAANLMIVAKAALARRFEKTSQQHQSPDSTPRAILQTLIVAAQASHIAALQYQLITSMRLVLTNLSRACLTPDLSEEAEEAASGEAMRVCSMVDSWLGRSAEFGALCQLAEQTELLAVVQGRLLSALLQVRVADTMVLGEMTDFAAPVTIPMADELLQRELPAVTSLVGMLRDLRHVHSEHGPIADDLLLGVRSYNAIATVRQCLLRQLQKGEVKFAGVNVTEALSVPEGRQPLDWLASEAAPLAALQAWVCGGGMPHLLRMVRRGSPEQRAAAVGAWRRIVAECASDLVDKGWLKVVACMLSSEGDAAERELAADTVTAIALQSTTLHPHAPINLVSLHEAVPPLVQLLGSSSASERVQSAAALRAVASTFLGAQEVVKAGGAAALLQLLVSSWERTDAKAMEQAAGAVLSIVMFQPLVAPVVQAGGVQQLVRVIVGAAEAATAATTAGDAWAGATAASLGALRSIAEDTSTSTHAAIVQAGGVPALVQLSAGGADQPATALATGTLRAMAAHSDDIIAGGGQGGWHLGVVLVL